MIPFRKILLAVSFLSAVTSFAGVDTTNTAFVGECSVRTDAGNFQSLGKFNLEVRDSKQDCPHASFKLTGFHPATSENSIYVEYQGSNASPKILTGHDIGYNDIRLYEAQVGNHLMAELTLNNGREAVCSGDVVKIE